MKQCLKTLLAVLSVSVLVRVAEAKDSTLKATLDDRAHLEGHGYSQTGNTETFLARETEKAG